jgi:hypothetical protein
MDLIRDNLAALRQQTTKSMVRVSETAYPLPNTSYPSDRYTTPDPISSQLSQGTITDALTHRPPTPDYPSPAHSCPCFMLLQEGCQSVMTARNPKAGRGTGQSRVLGSPWDGMAPLGIRCRCPVPWKRY